MRRLVHRRLFAIDVPDTARLAACVDDLERDAARFQGGGRQESSGAGPDDTDPHLRRFLRLRAPEHHDLAHALHDRRIRALTEGVAERRAGIAVRAADLHLDQLVGGQRAIDLRHHRIGQAGVSQLNDRFKGVGTGLQLGALACGQGDGHKPIVVARTG